MAGDMLGRVVIFAAVSPCQETLLLDLARTCKLSWPTRNDYCAFLAAWPGRSFFAEMTLCRTSRHQVRQYRQGLLSLSCALAEVGGFERFSQHPICLLYFGPRSRIRTCIIDSLALTYSAKANPHQLRVTDKQIRNINHTYGRVISLNTCSRGRPANAFDITVS
jgi:hypothetical protein